MPSPAPFDARTGRTRRALHAALLRFFDRHARVLPWRRTRDAYAIWVSEVMLQQTQVDRVIPFYERFLARFPTVAALAAADLGDVLSAWRGLGYYSRARNLHAAAQTIVASHGGHLPGTPEALAQLPGFGRYTAGAVASIAFQQPAALVDGNVARVLSRLFLVEGAPGDRRRDAALWTLADALVPAERPGDWNQALMELGATVCLPASPRCSDCPVRRACAALRAGREGSHPPPKAAVPKATMLLAVALVRRGGEVLLARRAARGLFGGLWELPCAPADEETAPALRALLPSARAVGMPLATVERTLTHRRLRLVVHPVEVGEDFSPPAAPYSAWRWCTPADVASLGISTAMERALAAGLSALDGREPSPPLRRAATRRAAAAARHGAPPGAAPPRRRAAAPPRRPA